PPSGPPSGMNFSRRKPTQPLPPLPAVTSISASSTSFMGAGPAAVGKHDGTQSSRPAHAGGPGVAAGRDGSAVSVPRKQQAPPERGLPCDRAAQRAAADQASATTLTVRRLAGPLIENSTLPSTSANRVWSRPRPTPAPGWNWVPRWRTMMLPASTAWPPKILTPRYFGLESRPLREEPTPFLCAMTNSPYLLSRRCR